MSFLRAAFFEKIEKKRKNLLQLFVWNVIIGADADGARCGKNTSPRIAFRPFRTCACDGTVRKQDFAVDGRSCDRPLRECGFAVYRVALATGRLRERDFAVKNCLCDETDRKHVSAQASFYHGYKDIKAQKSENVAR